MLAPKRPQQPQLVTLQAMIDRRAVLGAGDVDGREVFPSAGFRRTQSPARWPVPGSEDTELRCLMEQEADHGEASEVHT